MKYFVLFFTLMIATEQAIGGDWMQFRGSGGSATSDEKGLPTKWSAKENIVWRTKLPGPGTSSPITVGKRIYLTCYSGYGLVPGKGDMKKLMRHVVCVDRNSGNILFTRDFKPVLPESRYRGREDTEHGYSSSTPVSDGKRLYVFFGKSGVYCLDLDGKEAWHATVGSRATGWGSSNSPVLHKNLVIINASVESSSLVALGKLTGKEVWRAKNIRSSFNTPVLVDVPGGATELVVPETKALIGFDAATGKELWRVTGFGRYCCPSVVAHKGIVYLVRQSTLAIRAGGRGDVTKSHVLWRSTFKSRIPSPVYHDGYLYWSEGSTAICLNAKTGKEAYRKRLSPRTSMYASPIVADDRIYYVSRKDGVYVLPAEPTFKQLAHNTIADDQSRTNASPIVSDGCILFRTDRYLYCVGEE